MKKLLIILLLISITILSVSLSTAAAGDGLCTTNEAANNACGVFPPQSTGTYAGNGAVELCGDCYACGGVADGVCPEDFGADCSSCPDIDCQMTVSGTVYAPNEIDGVADVEIRPDLPGIPIASLPTTTTGADGTYSIILPPGNYELLFKKEGYGTERITIDGSFVAVNPSQDVTMQLPICNSDCTIWKKNYGNRCDVACDDSNGCTAEITSFIDENGNPQNINILQECTDQNKAAGSSIFLGINQVGEQVWGHCCSNPSTTTAFKQATTVETTAKTITQKTIPVTYVGNNLLLEGVRFHILVYEK